MEEEVLALKVVNESLKLPGVKVNRNAFLTKMFQDKVDNVQELFDDGPEKVLSKKELDRAAQKCINQAVMQSSTISFATGIPGGLAMAATIPADIAQFYGYSLKLAQEISYIYGYHDLWNNQDELTEEAKNTLILYLGIMLGVTSAGSVVRILSNRLSIQALKRLPQKALTKTFLFPILKKILAVFGTKLTKATFAKGVSKAIPVLGGVVSGGINYASMKPMAMRLKDELSKVKANISKDHVVYTLIDEHDKILRFLEDLEKVNSDIQNTKSYNEAKEKIHSLHNLAESILDAENHHQREEKVLFVEMEKREITGPTRIMRMEHDDLRARKKELKRLSKNADKMKFDEFKIRVDETSKYIIFNLRDHIFKENYILYPSSLEAIKEKDIWDDMKKRCDEIGYCSFTFENLK